jgi:C_GCAxxG_C_C family probable redox protein
MSSKTEKAVSCFRNGFNCAQSVLTVFSDDYHVSQPVALSISCGFGGGMGRLQETCGAVTGAFMAIGLHNCSKFSDNKDRKEHTYSMIQEFDKEFKGIHGTIHCGTLLGVDLKTEQGQKAFHDQGMHELICEKCIADSVQILEKYFD